MFHTAAPTIVGMFHVIDCFLEDIASSSHGKSWTPEKKRCMSSPIELRCWQKDVHSPGSVYSQEFRRSKVVHKFEETLFERFLGFFLKYITSYLVSSTFFVWSLTPCDFLIFYTKANVELQFYLKNGIFLFVRQWLNQYFTLTKKSSFAHLFFNNNCWLPLRFSFLLEPVEIAHVHHEAYRGSKASRLYPSSVSLDVSKILFI